MQGRNSSDSKNETSHIKKSYMYMIFCIYFSYLQFMIPRVSLAMGITEDAIDTFFCRECSSTAHITLRWRHNERGGVSNHRRLDCLPNRLLRRRSKKTSKRCIIAFVRGIHRWPVNSPHKGPVTRKMFLFDDVIMIYGLLVMPQHPLHYEII